MSCVFRVCTELAAYNLVCYALFVRNVSVTILHMSVARYAYNVYVVSGVVPHDTPNSIHIHLVVNRESTRVLFKSSWLFHYIFVS